MRHILIVLILSGCVAARTVTKSPDPLPTVPGPQMKAECAVDEVNIDHRWISFWAPTEKAQAMARFGWLDPNQLKPERWTITVDSRYLLEEVVAYINTCGDRP